MIVDGGKALVGLGGFTAYQTQLNSECRQLKYGSETACAKVRESKGKQPRPSAKVPKYYLSVK